MKASLWPRISSSLSLSPFFHFCMQQSNVNSTHWRFLVCVCVQGLDSFAAMPNSFRIPDGKMSSPVCSWRVVTPHNFWVCMKGGTEKRGRKKEEVGNPPALPTPHSLPPTDHWALFLLSYCEHFPPIRVDTRGVRGHLWPFMDHRERGGGGGVWRLSMSSLSGHVCPLPPSAHYKCKGKSMQTHWQRLLPCV